jgi:hypothetical protein
LSGSGVDRLCKTWEIVKGVLGHIGCREIVGVGEHLGERIGRDIVA